MSVFELFAAFGVFYQDFFLFACVGVFILVSESDACFHFVDVLSAFAAASKEVPRDAGGVDIHFDGVVDEWCDEDGGEACHAFALCVVG